MILTGTACGPFKRFAYEGFCRDRWQRPADVIRALAIRPGSAVVDLGAGGGYFTFRLADAVGADGTVYAVDIDPSMTAYLERRAREAGYGNVVTILADPDDPALPADGVDLVFTCNTYHHLQDRTAYFAALKPHLGPGGRVAIVEYRRIGWFQRLFGHYTEADVIRAEIEAAGFVFAEAHELPRQSFLVFRAAE